MSATITVEDIEQSLLGAIKKAIDSNNAHDINTAVNAHATFVNTLQVKEQIAHLAVQTQIQRNYMNNTPIEAKSGTSGSPSERDGGSTCCGGGCCCDSGHN